MALSVQIYTRVLVLEYRSAVALKLQPGEHGSLLALSSLRRAASTRYHSQQPLPRRAASTHCRSRRPLPRRAASAIDFTYLIPQEFTLLAPPLGTLWGGSGATVGRQCGCVRPCGENSCVPRASAGKKGELVQRLQEARGAVLGLNRARKPNTLCRGLSGAHIHALKTSLDAVNRGTPSRSLESSKEQSGGHGRWKRERTPAKPRCWFSSPRG